MFILTKKKKKQLLSPVNESNAHSAERKNREKQGERKRCR